MLFTACFGIQCTKTNYFQLFNIPEGNQLEHCYNVVKIFTTRHCNGNTIKLTSPFPQYLHCTLTCHTMILPNSILCTVNFIIQNNSYDLVYFFVSLSGGNCVLFVILDTRDAFHFSSGTTLAHSGMADMGSVIPDMTCLIRSTCSE